MAAFLSLWTIPGLILIVLAAALWRRLPVYDLFVEGATDGARLAVQLIPSILAIYVAIGVLRESGLLAGLAQLLQPIFATIGMPAPVLPLLVVRPFSHAAAMGLIQDILDRYGPDSFVGFLAAVLQGSSETTFYVLTVYLAAAGVKRSGHAVALCLLGDCIGFLASLWAARLFFPGAG